MWRCERGIIVVGDGVDKVVDIGYLVMVLGCIAVLVVQWGEALEPSWSGAGMRLLCWPTPRLTRRILLATEDGQPDAVLDGPQSLGGFVASGVGWGLGKNQGQAFRTFGSLEQSPFAS